MRSSQHTEKAYARIKFLFLSKGPYQTLNRRNSLFYKGHPQITHKHHTLWGKLKFLALGNGTGLLRVIAPFDNGLEETLSQEKAAKIEEDLQQSQYFKRWDCMHNNPWHTWISDLNFNSVYHDCCLRHKFNKHTLHLNILQTLWDRSKPSRC